jgi:hypothetical protein
MSQERLYAGQDAWGSAVIRARAVAMACSAPPELRRQRDDRVTEHLQVTSRGAGASAAAAHHPGQRLVGVIAVPEHRSPPW